ncbi:hypothetical protein ILUMI_02732 [Ignelater luminosus]|uniref:Uncharacterized protein n=1 Tax=Ignelater luminosus TaxID=2038154 RepID=A0A8K0GL38_IGNLU|nr:hypothetical protein ILUMI_02732 [Ignelater luminosus]
MINPSIPAPTLSIRSLSTGYKIFFHGPNEIPEMSTKTINTILDKIIYLDGETCRCFHQCDVDAITISKYEITDWFLGTNIQWKVTHYPTIRYKHSLIFSSTSALGNYRLRYI